MPRHKQTEGATAVLERKARGFSVDDALRLVYAVEDALSAVLRAKPKDKAIGGALSHIAALREELEDRSDVEAAREAKKEMGSIPWEEVKKKAGL